MRPTAITNALFWGLLGVAPIASGLSIPGSTDVERRYVGSGAAIASKFVRSVIEGLEARHHTEAQIAAKEAAAKKKGGKKHEARDAEEVPEDDEFGSWVTRRDPHHTEAQIAAKEAAANKGDAKKGDKKGGKKGGKKDGKKQQARDADVPEDDEFGSWADKREPHHTEAQIAAKEAAAKKKGEKKGGKKHQAREDDVIPEDDEFGSWADKREPHHTEAQIAAKEAATKKGGKKGDNKGKKGGKKDAKKQQAREVDEVPEDDEFGSWADKREPHHTEAQIAAKEAAAKKKNGTKKDGKKDGAKKDGKKQQARDVDEVPEDDEFGSWSDKRDVVPEDDEFGSWADKREPHHTEAQIAAKEAAAKKKNGDKKPKNKSN
ncbi:hypothetical protein V8C35DRAFT_310658 [Trichoderma chlorosporum]